ncbi:MAG: extracellular solute-binding protein [Oscillospiraceae bacterium]|nr:extracellular solute-binding protein [Oscillospiraceae bacterium]MBR3556059.1 extracellular solute-binding protein [Oscillospiraceae bacterium]
MKRLFSLLLCLLMVPGLLLLPGCHGSRSLPDFVPPERFDESRSYTVTFWAKNDTNKTQTRIYEKAIADFQALYPNITVNLRLYTDYSKIYNDVITNISTNTTPNVCITYPDHIATYLTGSSTVVPLDALFADPDYGLGGAELRFSSPREDEVVPQFLGECAFADHHYAIPFMRSTEACYVNKTFVEALGYTLPETLTWDFVWEVSEAAMAKDSQGNYLVNGQKVMIPFIYKSTDNMMIQMLRQKGADYSTPEGDILLFNDTTRELLYTVAEHAATGAFSTFKISSYPGNFLNAGQCIFAVDSTAGATWMGSRAPLMDISADRVVDFETAVLPIPQFDPQAPRMISQGPSICVFNKADPQEVLASWLFAQYLLTDGVQTAYAETEGYVPVTRTAQTSPEYRDYLDRCGEDDLEHYEVKIRASQLLLDHVGDTFVTPVFNGSASLRDAAGQLIENTAKSVRRKETVDDAYMDELFRDVSSLYRLGSSTAGGRKDLGPLPGTAVFLLAALGAVWVLLLAYWFIQRLRKRKQENGA